MRPRRPLRRALHASRAAAAYAARLPRGRRAPRSRGSSSSCPEPLVLEHPERVGYLLKERVFDVAILIDALRRIADGETVIDPTIVSRLIGRRRREDPLAELTEREREVLSLVARVCRTRGSPPASSSPSAPSRRT
jgi:hypothetical protein